MSNIPNTAISELTALINSTNKKEAECRKYLRYAHAILFREDVLKQVIYEEPELIGSTGISDYVISGNIGNDPISDIAKMYVWELKAPQCFLFRMDNKNRLCPTPDLIDAENQLLCYADELRGNDTLRNRFGVTHPEYVCPGGIVIGCNQTLVKGILEDSKKKKLCVDALRIRNEWFYKRAGIRLITWSDILSHITGNFEGIIKQNINPEFTFQTPKIPDETVSKLESLNP